MAVRVRDARRLSPAAQEDLRRRAVAAVKAGRTQVAVAAVLGVSPQAVSRWVNAFDRKGNRALNAGKRGRRAGEQKALDARQEARVRRAVLGNTRTRSRCRGWCGPARRYANWYGT